MTHEAKILLQAVSNSTKPVLGKANCRWWSPQSSPTENFISLQQHKSLLLQTLTHNDYKKKFFLIKLLILCYSGMFEKVSLICYYLRRKFMYLRHLYLPISSWTIHILCWVFYWMLVSPKVTTLVCHVDAHILPS